MSKKKLYILFLIATLLGYMYFFYSLQHNQKTSLRFCMIKNVTGIPCPSCGTTRAIQLLLHGKFISSIEMNPLGILVAFLMVIVPFWIVIDLVFKKDTFFKKYRQAETIINRRPIAFFLIVLIIINWIWNIKKGL